MKQLLLAMLCLATLAGCMRGTPSDKTPIHVNPNMDDQPRYDVQSRSQFFADSATMRVPPAGTVARGYLRDDDAMFAGKNADGSLVAKSPVTTTMPLLKRGQERYNIYCSPCHSRMGDGKGIMIQRGYLPPPSFHEERLVKVTDGHIIRCHHQRHPEYAGLSLPGSGRGSLGDRGVCPRAPEKPERDHQ